MPSFITARREPIAWIVSLLSVAALVVTLSTDRADAGGVAPVITTEVVYIATGANYPDALAAGPAAGVGLGPVLLVEQNAIPAATLAELNRLVPQRVIIVGGTAVISDAVLNAIAALAFSPDVTRVSGADRYETAAELSQATFPTTGYYPRAAFAYSDDLPTLTAGLTVTALTTTITAPTNGILVISAGADTFRGTNDAVLQCWIERNSTIVTGSIRFVTLTTNVTSADCHTEVAIAVAPGEHVVEFVTHQDSDVSADDGALTVTWIPFAGDGSVPVVP